MSTLPFHDVMDMEFRLLDITRRNALVVQVKLYLRSFQVSESNAGKVRRA
jgi:hypothetical protein